MPKGFRQPTPEQREADRIAHLARPRGAEDFCDGCGVRFRPSWANVPGACTQCCTRWGVYAIRYE